MDYAPQLGPLRFVGVGGNPALNRPASTILVSRGANARLPEPVTTVAARLWPETGE